MDPHIDLSNQPQRWRWTKRPRVFGADTQKGTEYQDSVSWIYRMADKSKRIQTDEELVEEFFYGDGAPRKCTKCGCKKIREKILGHVDVFYGSGPVCERECFCQDCGESLGYWAYGSWDSSPMTAFVEEVKAGRELPAGDDVTCGTEELPPGD